MTAAAALGCVKGERHAPCPRTPVVVYMVGPACSAHLVPGAVALQWLSPLGPDERDLMAAMAGPSTPVGVTAFTALGLLPDPGRPVAAAHADAAPGEANAARLVAYRAGTLRLRVLEHLVDAGPRGTTAIEAWHWYRDTHSPGIERYSVAPRLSELVGDGWASKTGATRNVRGPGYPPEEVYVLSARGRREKGLSW